jgi:hypothetical protein
MLSFMKSTAIRFISPAMLAERVIGNPTVIGPNRATALFNLATTGATPTRRALGRRALQAAAKAGGRHVLVYGVFSDRVFSKASNARLKNWAQNINTPV